MKTKENDLITGLNYEKEEKWTLRVYDTINEKESFLIDDTTGLTYFYSDCVVYKGEDEVGELFDEECEKEKMYDMIINVIDINKLSYEDLKTLRDTIEKMKKQK